MITIRKAEKNDLEVLAALAQMLWPEHTQEDLISEYADIINDDTALFYIICESCEPAGFAQCQLRFDYVEGTGSSPVGYLEGIFVKPEFRMQGFARALLKACEAWALEKGCTEFASDCELTNETSRKFHMNTGFAEANRIICFTKKLKY